jgi:hypothetical protein
VALRPDLLDLSVEVSHPLADSPPLNLDLLLAKTPASPHPTSTPTNLSVICVCADESGQKVMEACGLDLQAAFMSARVLGEDLQDDLGAVEHPRLQLQLEVALLSRAQVLIADDKVELAFHLHGAQSFHLAHADEMGGIDLGATLEIRTDDFRSRCAREIGQLSHLFANKFGPGAGEQHPDEVSPLARGPGCNQSLSALIRVIASSSRASGAVTDRRK